MNKDTLERLRETVLVPHGDPQLALYAKLVVDLLWLVHLPLGFLYGAPLPFYLLLGGMMLLDGVNLFLSRRSASRARELGAALAFLAGSALLFQKAYVGYFSWFFLLIFSFSCTFALGLVDGTFINLLSFLWVMACLRGGLIPDPAALYGESFVRRFPFLYICILGVAYIIMFSIQRYWVDKAKRHLLLQQRIDAEKGKLSEMSLKVITAMYSALSSKIPEIDLHCQQTAELTQEMARRMGLDEAACRDGYYAGLLHEVGTVGLPDDVVLQRNITEEQYQLYKTYVERGCRIIQELQIVDRVARPCGITAKITTAPATLRGCRARPSRCCPASSLWPTSRPPPPPGRDGRPNRRGPPRVCDMRSTHSAEVMCGMLTERT